MGQNLVSCLSALADDALLKCKQHANVSTGHAYKSFWRSRRGVDRRPVHRQPGGSAHTVSSTKLSFITILLRRCLQQALLHASTSPRHHPLGFVRTYICGPGATTCCTCGACQRMARRAETCRPIMPGSCGINRLPMIGWRSEVSRAAYDCAGHVRLGGGIRQWVADK